MGTVISINHHPRFSLKTSRRDLLRNEAFELIERAAEILGALNDDDKKCAWLLEDTLVFLQADSTKSVATADR